METETMTKYVRKGQVQGAVTSIILLIVGASVATMILIFSGALSGQVYEKVEADITAITNDTIETHIKKGIISGFEAFEDTGDYLSIVILAVIITVVLGLVLGLLAITNMGFGGGGRGMAL